MHNNRPVSLTPFCGKKHLIYNEMYLQRIDNSSISSNQSGFRQGDSYIKGTDMQIEKALINYRLRVSKVS